ncbi:MAG: hypothetical protein ACRBCJ_01350 [Hyphomicrobiaceae bacterium]
MLLTRARHWSVLTFATFTLLVLIAGPLSPKALAGEEGVCVEVSMDTADLHLSYRKELEVRIDRSLVAAGIDYLGIKSKDKAIEVLVSDTRDGDRAVAAVQQINAPLEIYGSKEFDLVNNGDGRLIITPTAAAFTEAEDAAMAALSSRMRLLANRITNDKSKYTPQGRESFLLLAPGIKDLAEFQRRVVFTPGVNLSFRLWKKPKDGESEVAHEPGTMEPVRQGFTNRRLVLIPKKAFADGREIVSAVADQVDGKSGLKLQFSGRGQKKISKVTQNNKGATIVIVLDKLIFGEYEIDGLVNSAELFVPIKGTDLELSWLADKIQAGGYQPEYKIEQSAKCKL